MYTPKLVDIMGQVELFYTIFEFPMANGRNYRTQYFKENLTFEEFSNYFHSKSKDSYHFYQNVENKVKSFKDALREFVAQDDFVEKWADMNEKERNKFLYFDEDSYIILREKLSKDDLIVIDWKELMKAVDVKWDNNLSKILALPIECEKPPENRLQALKQKKALIQAGYDEKKVSKIYESLEIRPEIIAKELLGLVSEDCKDIEKLFNDLNVSTPFWINYDIAFVKEQENRFSNLKSNTNKPKM